MLQDAPEGCLGAEPTGGWVASIYEFAEFAQHAPIYCQEALASNSLCMDKIDLQLNFLFRRKL